MSDNQKMKVKEQEQKKEQKKQQCVQKNDSKRVNEWELKGNRIKGIVHMKTVTIYSPSCRSKPASIFLRETHKENF